MLISLSACSSAYRNENGQDIGQNNNGHVNKEQGDTEKKPSEYKEESEGRGKIEVREFEVLHNGRAWDISPDGKKLLFSWDEDSTEIFPDGEVRPPSFLYEMDLEDQSITKLSGSQRNQGFAKYSPDGNYIAFMENEGELFTPFIMENRPGAEKIKLEEQNKDGLLVSPHIGWSPESKNIAISKSYLDIGKILIFDTEGNEKRAIEGGKMMVPYFVDNERLILVYDYAEDGMKGVTDATVGVLDLSDINDTQPEQIVSGLDYALSPDKQRLAYITRTQDGEGLTLQVAALDTNLNKASELAEFSMDWGYQYKWSPDSRYLLYSADDGVWAVNPDTELTMQLAEGMSLVLNLHWARDNEIIFTGIPKDGDYDTVKIYRLKLS